MLFNQKGIKNKQSYFDFISSRIISVTSVDEKNISRTKRAFQCSGYANLITTYKTVHKRITIVWFSIFSINNLSNNTERDVSCFAASHMFPYTHFN